LEAANLECHKLTAICVGAAVDNPRDSRLALERAIALRQKAFSEYRKALQDWTDSYFNVIAS
jgi:hypothetical protein